MPLEHEYGKEHEPLWRIEFAEPGDSAGITAVQREAWLAMYPDSTIGLTREDIEAVGLGSPERLQKWERRIEEQGEGKRIWRAREGSEIIGFSVAGKTPERHELQAIYVLPAHHGKKVGKALMDTAIAWLGNDRDVCVWVFTHNKKAIEFYGKYGFRKSGKNSSLAINGKAIPDLEMVRKATARSVDS